MREGGEEEDHPESYTRGARAKLSLQLCDFVHVYVCSSVCARVHL